MHYLYRSGYSHILPTRFTCCCRILAAWEPVNWRYLIRRMYHPRRKWSMVSLCAVWLLITDFLALYNVWSLKPHCVVYWGTVKNKKYNNLGLHTTFKSYRLNGLNIIQLKNTLLHVTILNGNKELFLKYSKYSQRLAGLYKVIWYTRTL